MKKLFFTSLLSVLYICAQAQNMPELPSKCDAFLPQVLLESKVLKESATKALVSGAFGQDIKPSQKKYWIVFSDRSNNQTYSAPGGQPTGKTLDFNEKLRIASIKNGYALVYDEPNAKMKYPKISADAECKGWVKMSSLLLWDTCLADEKGIYYKALLCANADVKGASKWGNGYLNPTDNSSAKVLTLGMKFYFIMKRSGDGKVLLATQHNMNDGLSSKVLEAWVPEESYVPWNQRSCIEPTWDQDDVEELSKRKFESVIYFDKTLKDKATTLPFQFKGFGDDEYQYRMNPVALRFPILDGTNSSLYECSSFTSPNGSTNGSIMDEAGMTEEKIRILEEKKHVNLAIVIDGTQSMDPFFPAVKKAIIDGCNFFNDDKYEVKVGVMIYRDYADGDVDSKNGLCEMIPFDSPKNVINSPILSGGSYGIKSAPSDKTYTEALYYGLNEALDKFKFKDGQNNMMLVIGDCGNAENDPKSPAVSTIVDKFVAKNVNLVSYQVRNYDANAWNLFNKQMLSINKQSMQKKYDDNFRSVKTKVKAKVTSNGQTFYNSSNPKYYYYGSHSYATQGTEISPDVLTNLIKNTIKDYSTKVQEEIDGIINMDPGEISKEVSFEGSVEEDVIAYKMNMEYFKKLFGSSMSKVGLIGFKGWSKKQLGEIDIYKPVLFISSEEFDELLTQLKLVDDVAQATGSDDREPYIKAMKQLLKNMAPGLTDSEMAEYSIDVIMQMMAGLNEPSSSLKYSLKDIADPTAINNAMYRKMVSEFARKYKNLQNIKDGNYKFVREFNGAKYYWIPIEDLP